MIDHLVAIGLSNACFALLLAIVAMLASAKARRPHLAHLLWVLVLVKLVTPPLVSIPVGLFPRSSEASTQGALNEAIRHAVVETRPTGDAALDNEDRSTSNAPAHAVSCLSNIAIVWHRWTPWLGASWLLGSGVVLLWSLVRVFQFNRLLRADTAPAPQELLTMTNEVAMRLKVGAIPHVCTTSANISPMVWWTGGRVRVVIPTTLLEQMERRQWRCILAHELAHVRRRDYLVRWLEWLACVSFWWNPVVWWAQRNLRLMEEICCDSLVISTLQPQPHAYANSILTACESLARPIIRPPVMASEINSGGSLERRFSMMISNRVDQSNSRTTRGLVLLAALVTLPLGIASAQDFEAVEKRLGKAISKGELTIEHAGVMMDALKKAGHKEYRQDGASHADRIENRVREFGDQLKAAVLAGKMTEEQAWARWHGFREGQVVPRVIAAVESGDLTERKKRFEKGAKLLRELEGHFERLGVDVETFKKVRKNLIDNGIQHGQVDRTLGGMLRVIHELRSEGERFELDPRLRDYFDEELGLTEEQIELVEGLSRRVAHGLEESHREHGSKRFTRDDYARAEADLRKAVADEKVSEEDARDRLEGMRKAMADQRERWVDGDQRPNWDGIRRRIEGAVERGDLTREEADAKYQEIKEKMSREEDDDDDDDPPSTPGAPDRNN